LDSIFLATRQPADTEGNVQAQRAGRHDAHLRRRDLIAHAHDAALAKLLLDGGHGDLEAGANCNLKGLCRAIAEPRTGRHPRPEIALNSAFSQQLVSPVADTPAGAFHATRSKLSHPRDRGRGPVRTPLPRNDPAFQNDTGTLGDVPGGSAGGRRLVAVGRRGDRECAITRFGEGKMAH
jgi:hypothetical protein